MLGPAAQGGARGAGGAGGIGAEGSGGENADGGKGGSGGNGGFGAGGGGDGADGAMGDHGLPATAGMDGTAGLAGQPTTGPSGTPGSGGHGGNGGAGGAGASGGAGGDGGANGGGGGGLAAGGDIFVAQGGQLIIEGGSLSGGKVLGGSGGSADASANAGDAGSGFGAGIFIMGNGSIDLSAPLGQVVTVSDQISDQSGSDPTNMFQDPGAGRLIITGAGTIDLNAANNFVGGTTIESGALEFGAAGAAGTGTIAFSGPAELQLNFAANAVPKNAITGFSSGDTIVIDGFVETSFGYGASGLILNGANATSATLDIPGLSLANFDVAPNAGSNLTTVTATCFAAGTHIATETGGVAVESLKVGDYVMLHDGHAAPIIWIGHRRIECSRHPNPKTVWPVRVEADAFGPGRPHRDLFLSPDHAVFTDGVLIPVKYLINGSSVAQVAMLEVIYFHVELSAHDVMIAEGLPAESYLDTGDRSNFDNGGDAITLHPDFSARVWDAMGCAQLIVSGPRLDAVRRQMDEYATAIVRNDAASPTRAASRFKTF
jgi:collagen type I/II/III/V/XI/XXIV/XXVII alpha